MTSSVSSAILRRHPSTLSPLLTFQLVPGCLCPNLHLNHFYWRNIPMYTTPDLIKSAAIWVSRLPSRVAHAPRCFMKRMDLPRANVLSSNVSITSSTAISTLANRLTYSIGLGEPGVSDKKAWDQFKATKWTTLTWTDFLSSGFSRASSPLNAMLQIDPGAAGRCHPQGEEDVEAPPTVRIGHRACHGHGGDYRGSIIDVFCDFVYGVGWIDICRGDVDNRALTRALPPPYYLPKIFWFEYHQQRSARQAGQALFSPCSREDTTGLSLTPNARLFGPTSSQTEVIDFVTRLASYTTMGLICFV
ncbi:hypothetical protein DFH94DRAFT_816107 [Russula ochroleuca]|uniref:Uncharacterized protein n=1 Tax=Russula ochroleuca TaxID=152965 RepID=A0A9P5JXE9_9AGAM|nr:hypothetical protein DFH94DRAFT_816107 [Russula ochroleuca]